MSNRQEMVNAIARIANAKRPTAHGQTCRNEGVIGNDRVEVAVTWTKVRTTETYYLNGTRTAKAAFFGHFGVTLR